MTTRFVSLELENFRGFANTTQFDLDSDVILIRGDNGTGKTSLTDGILWVLVGGLPHLADRVKGLRPTHDPIANRYVDPAQPSRVSLVVRRGASQWLFERTGNSKKSQLSASQEGTQVDAEAGLLAAFGEDDLEELKLAVQTWGVLRQDAIRSVLDSGGAALHQRMSSIIGLDEVTRFVDACRAATKAATQQRKDLVAPLATAKARTEDVRARLQVASDGPGAPPEAIAQRATAALAELSDEVVIHAQQIATLDDVTRLGRSLGRLVELAGAPASTYEQLVRDRAAISRSSDQLAIDLATAEKQAADLDGQASDTQRLAEAALGLLSDHCPVCAQEINEDQVRASLERVLAQANASTGAAAEARATADSIRRNLSQTRSSEASVEALQRRLTAQTTALDEAVLAEAQIGIDDSLRDAGSLGSLARRLDDVRAVLRRVYAEVSAESSLDIETLRAELGASEKALSETQASYDRAAAAAETTSRVEKAARNASEQIVSGWLRELEPRFAEVFDRLAPHPTFSELRARQDVYYNKNQIVPDVNDPVRGVSANPLLVYSEGQLNTVALSYFLGLAFNAPSDAVGFMVLDDPLQAMDVLAVLGFADLCRRLRGHRQLLLTTHDRRFATVLDRKLAPRESGQSTVIHEFDSWSPNGPVVRSSRREHAPHSPVLWGEPA